MRRFRRGCLLGLACVLAGKGLLAADEATRAYRAARIIVAPEEPDGSPGYLLVRGKLVEGVIPAESSVPQGATVVDLGAVVLVPGFVSPVTAVSEATYRATRGPGILTVAGGQPQDARSRVATPSSRPEDQAAYRRLGRTGYGAFGWVPDSGGFIAAQASVLRPAVMEEKDGKALMVKEAAYLLMSFEMGKSWREVADRELRKAADAIVRAEEERKKASEKKPEEKAAPERSGERAAEPPALQAQPKPQPQAQAQPQPPDPLVRAFRGEIPIFVRIRSPAALDHFFRIFDALPVRPALVLLTPPLPPETVERLSARRGTVRAVVVEPRISSVWETSVLTCTPRAFLEKGFEVALAPLSDTLEGHEEMPLRLAEMVKSGLTRAEALASVTTVPARLIGLDGRVGVLRKGAFASFAAFDGDPLSGTALLRRVFVEGVEVFCLDTATGRLSGEAVR